MFDICQVCICKLLGYLFYSFAAVWASEVLQRLNFDSWTGYVAEQRRLIEAQTPNPGWFEILLLGGSRLKHCGSSSK